MDIRASKTYSQFLHSCPDALLGTRVLEFFRELLEELESLSLTEVSQIFSVDKHYSKEIFARFLPLRVHSFRALLSEYLFKVHVLNNDLHRDGFLISDEFVGSALVEEVLSQHASTIHTWPTGTNSHPRHYPCVALEDAVKRFLMGAGALWGADHFCGLEIVGEQDGIQSMAHTDTFHPTLKWWLALGNIDIGMGPFGYFRRSHQMNWHRLLVEERKIEAGDFGDKGSFRFTDDEIKECHPEAELIQFCIPKGTLVVANTRGIHLRMPAPRSRVRLCVHASLRASPFVVTI